MTADSHASPRNTRAASAVLGACAATLLIVAPYAAPAAALLGLVGAIAGISNRRSDGGDRRLTSVGITLSVLVVVAAMALFSAMAVSTGVGPVGPAVEAVGP